MVYYVKIHFELKKIFLLHSVFVFFVERQFMYKCVQTEIYVLLTAQTVDLRTETGMIREITLMTGTFRPTLNLLATDSNTY